MRILASSHGTRPALPGASKSALSQRAVVPKAAPSADAKAEAAAAGDVDGGGDNVVATSSSSDATSSAPRCALAAVGLAASLILVRRGDCDLSSGGH